MTEKIYRFEVPEVDLDAFLCTLVLGTLEAMRSGQWPLSAGIWTLARPVFREPLERARVSAELIDVLREADELSALGQLSGGALAASRLDAMIGTVRSRLAANSAPVWRATVRD